MLSSSSFEHEQPRVELLHLHREPIQRRLDRTRGEWPLRLEYAWLSEWHHAENRNLRRAADRRHRVKIRPNDRERVLRLQNRLFFPVIRYRDPDMSRVEELKRDRIGSGSAAVADECLRGGGCGQGHNQFWEIPDTRELCAADSAYCSLHRASHPDW
jgi:hypothetical protein